MASVDLMCVKSVFLLIFTFIISKCNANDILGCGGFVKSHVNLDFSKIEIGLYTKAGSLKERTECAPTNGYYFLPLYEKGDYVLKVHPPPGWSFEPSKVELHVDGTTDLCSTGQDINFAFNGFGITGRVVTAGQAQGPSSISVQLIDEKGNKRDTVTTVGGDFHFTPVIPGKYTLKASHPTWKLDPGQAIVQVTEGNTVLPTGVLTVKGYDVKGSITSYGNPIGGVYVLLYSKEENPKFRVEGCITALLQSVPDAPICHSITNPAGEFTFGLVPAGQYKLLALSKNPGQAALSYNIRPESVTFEVKHDSLYITNAFEVTGFTVVGSVLRHVSGAGLGGVRVSRDGHPAGTTDDAGKFTLPSLEPGTYSLSFQHEQCEIPDVQLSVTSSGPRSLPAGVAEAWRVCGAVAPASRGRRVLVTPATPPRPQHALVDDDGKWCTFLPPGVYTVAVEVSEQEQRDGLQFYPVSQKVSVGHAPVSGVSFSQLKATLSGRVRCRSADACRGVPVTLRPLPADDAGSVPAAMYTVAKDGEYKFEEVLPGTVEVSVNSDRLCWKKDRHTVSVTQATATVPAFEHSGHVLRVQSTHPVEVEYTSGADRGVLSVPTGASRQCVESAAVYTLAPRGCHRFQPPQVQVDTAAERLSTAYLVAVSHAVTVSVWSPDAVQDLVLVLRSDAGSTRAGPLVPQEQDAGGYLYEHTMYMAEGEVTLVSAESSTLLFRPSAPQQVVGGSSCQPAALRLRSVRALTLSGRTRPPVEGVTITLTADDVQLTQTTSADGTYRFGPLDASKQYSLTAEKESYVFEAPDAAGDIAAHKLAEVDVLLVDAADNTPLQSALVSVSGGSYRRNAASGADGRLRFASLSPAEYYVKPNMKEYRFQPPHQIVAVKEGKTHHITLRGVRVAWSCMGKLLSLGGVGWGHATLLAVPRDGGPAHCAIEEATTETSGAFRIRGLLPSCVYSLQLKESSAHELSGLKLAMAPDALEVKDNKDIVNVRLIAVQPQQVTDASVLVYTPNVDHYKSLRLTLSPESSPTSPLYSSRLDPAGYSQGVNPGLMYVLPRLPADNKSYVLQLESTLSKTTHLYDDEVHYFHSDGRFKSFTIHFLPKVKSSEQELRQTSLLVIPCLLLVVLAYLHRDELASRGAQLAAGAARAGTRPARAQRPDLLDKASIDQIVSSVNAAGKKTSKKKAL